MSTRLSGSVDGSNLESHFINLHHRVGPNLAPLDRWTLFAIVFFAMSIQNTHGDFT